MSEITFGEYEAHARSTAYFLEDPSSKSRFEKIYYGFNEEVDELLYDPTHPEALTSLLLGHDSADETVRNELIRDKTSEVGDILYYISATAMLHEVALEKIAYKGVELYAPEKTVENDLTFKSFDTAVYGQIETHLPENYNPNYFGMQLFNISPFQGGDFNQYNPSESVGPMVLTADTRYAIERTTRAFSERIVTSDYLSEEDFIATAGLALGALSIVLQHRFGVTLEDAAINNVMKRERRKQASTLSSGVDEERSRKNDDVRPKIKGFDNTLANLVFAPQPLG